MKDRLPARAGIVGVTTKENRIFFKAVLYRYRSSITWRDLPDALVILESCTLALAIGLKWTAPHILDVRTVDPIKNS
ncbi:hypothetical protein [Acinetobacter sp. BSP-28]|uniref:hypothetical protein n=1 Tax=Acinetobacter sp. BSP-28 TaxID=3344661 RepID=UPI00376FC583